MLRWRGRQTQLDRIEVIQRLAPQTSLRRRVATVTLVSDNQIEGVDRDIELLGVILDALLVREDCATTKEVDRHPLNCADVDEGRPGFRVGQVGLRQDGGIELVIITEILALEALRIHLIQTVELLTGLRLEALEGTDRLSSQRLAVDKKENTPGNPGLHQPVDLVDRRQGLARAGGHREQHFARATGKGLLNRLACLDLVRPDPRVDADRVQTFEVSIGVPAEQLGQRLRCMEAGDFAGTVLRATNVVKHDALAIGRVEERHVMAVREREGIPR